jgi:malonate transporter and related proteins
MAEILNLAMPFFGLILLGVIAARLWREEEQGLRWLNIFLIYFALPALIFKNVASAPFEQLIGWPFMLATSSVTVAAYLGIFAAARWMLGVPYREAVLQGVAGSYGNVGYMGLPLAVAFFGPEAAVPAALVFCFDCTLQFALTAFLVTVGHEDNDDAHWGEVTWRILREVFTHPFIVATLLGVAASAFAFKAPGALATIIDMLTNSAGPCALFALGVTVGLRQFAGIGRELPMIAVVKTLVQPALALLIVGLLPGLNPVWLHVAVMMAALPTASNAFILATQYRAHVAGASTAVIVTTIMSAITIPLLVYLIQRGVLP